MTKLHVCVFYTDTILPNSWIDTVKRNYINEPYKATYENYHFTFSTVGLFLDSYCYLQLINFLYPGNENYTKLLQSEYWLSAKIHISFDTLLYLAEVFKILCLKFSFIVFQYVGTQAIPDIVNQQEYTMLCIVDYWLL